MMMMMMMMMIIIIIIISIIILCCVVLYISNRGTLISVSSETITFAHNVTISVIYCKFSTT